VNRLAQESSPYLRQHGDNPVDWYPWGEEAFSRARTEGKPVMLSVGYSTCHWCHVMAHESFEDEATAGLLNERFVSVKVDREERPDVDAVYMEAVQAMTGRGGWPMTVFITADGLPFYGGTYFPKERRGGLPSFRELLVAIDDAWRNRRAEVDSQADQLARAITERTSAPERPGAPRPAAGVLNGAVRALRSAHDDRWGGFGTAPKFPQPSLIELALRSFVRTGDAALLDLASTTLGAMASGGIYDHLGGGFARYSVDSTWTVPHFEKMLYDQAMLVRSYLHGWQLTGDGRWLQVVEETIGYVLRDLRTPEGALSSAEDADSEGEEGRFYVWSLAEIEAVLGSSLSPTAIAWYGVTEEGNFEGANILRRPLGGALLRPPDVERARALLFDARAGRVRPGLDGKILTEWNAMFCATLAEAAGATTNGDWAVAADQVAEFLLAHLRRPEDGRWLRSFSDGAAHHLAYAADYAWLVEAFVRLAEATGRARWMSEAVRTADSMLELFWDRDGGGLFTTGEDAEQLIVRSKELFDGATPSANAVAALALLRLATLTGRSEYGDRAGEILALLPLDEHPLAFAHSLWALEARGEGLAEVVVTGDRPDLVGEVRRRYLPNAVLAWGEPYPSPLWESRPDGMAFVCRDYACLRPVADVGGLSDQLDQLVRS
jgi:uncharacterized protein YyaL (SSP411 family)